MPASREPAPPEIRLLPPGSIRAGADQPRQEWRAEETAALAASIRELGVLQPVVVRACPDGAYELVAGERRLRAAQEAGLAYVPAVVLRVGDVEAALARLAENLQRRDLSAVEVAEGLWRVRRAFGLRQEELARRLGLSQAAVANKMRLTRLDARVKDLARRERIGERHLRALLRLPEGELQVRLAEEIVEGRLTVREVERRVGILLGAGREGRVRLGALRDVRIVLNTFRTAVAALAATGVAAELQEEDLGEVIEVVIRVGKRRASGARRG